MTKLQIVTSRVFELLNENVNYAVLRNFEGLPLNNPGRDIDIIIDKADFNSIKNKLIYCFEESSTKIISYYKIERESFILAIRDSDSYSLLQFDFLLMATVAFFKGMPIQPDGLISFI